MNRSSRSLPRRLLARALAFPGADRAVAVVEFALIVPLMLVLYIGSVEVSQGIAADRKLATVAGAMGDLVAQTSGRLPTATLNDYFTAAEALMLPFDGGRVRQTIAIVYVAPDGTTQIAQSRSHNGGTPHVPGQPYALPAEITAIARDTHVVVSEASFVYTPLLGHVVRLPIGLSKQFFFLPRHGTRIEIV